MGLNIWDKSSRALSLLKWSRQLFMVLRIVLAAFGSAQLEIEMG
jgi:hypothetical protein